MNERKKPPASARKPIKRKPKDMPKRPLSAYNYFFKEQRQQIIKAVHCADKRNQKMIDPYLTADLIKKLKRDNGHVSFEEVGKVIGSRWKVVREIPDRVICYALLAKTDADRYAKDMEMYNLKKAQMSYDIERSSDMRYTMPMQGHHMNCYAQYQQSGMSVTPSGTHYDHRGYNNGYQMDAYEPHSFGPSPMISSYNAYYRSDAPYAANHYYVNNMLEHNTNSINVQNTSGYYSSNGHPIQMSHLQAPSNECASYPREQCSIIQRPRHQTISAHETVIPHNAYYYADRGF